MLNYITKPKPGVMINPLHPLSKGLVGYWLFNEGAGSLANDISGHKNHGKLINVLPNAQGSGWCDSKYGGGIAFDGTNDYVNCGNDASLDITDEITIETRIKIKDVISTEIILSKAINSDWSSPFALYHISVATDNKLAARFSEKTLTDSHSLSNGWHDFFVVYDKNDGYIRLFADGAALDTTPYSTVIGTSIYNLAIGASAYNDQNYSGTIDKVSIYNRALSASEVKMLYEQPYCNLL